MPLGTATSAGNIRDVYLFNGAINPVGIQTNTGVVDLGDATSDELLTAGIIGCWKAQYDPNGVVNNPFDQNAVAVSTNTSVVPNTVGAKLAPLPGREFEGTSLYINGYAMPLTLSKWSAAPPSMSRYSRRIFAAGLQCRRLPDGGNQPLADGAPAVSGDRRHVRTAGAEQRTVPRDLPERIVRGARRSMPRSCR